MLRYIHNFANMHEDEKSNRSTELCFGSKTSLDTYEYLKFTRGITVEIGPFQPLLLVVGFKVHQEKKELWRAWHNSENVEAVQVILSFANLKQIKDQERNLRENIKSFGRNGKHERNVWRHFDVSLRFKSKHKSYKAKCRFVLIKI